MGGDIGEIKLGSETELYKYINHYVVVKRGEKKKKKEQLDYISTGEHYICTSGLQ